MIENMLFYDTETCGLHGPIVLMQWGFIDGEITLYEPWHNTINATIEKIEWIATHTICAFNLSYDWFHTCQMYTTLLVLRERVGGEEILGDHIEEYAECEPLGRDGPCLKPAGCLDLMLVAQKGQYQAIMNRKPIRIRRVPNQLAQPLADFLETYIEIPDIYFARSKEKGPRWKVTPFDKDFSNVELKFKPSTALKALAKEVFEYTPRTFAEIEVDKKFRPIEVGWAPFALALSSAKKRWRAKKKDKEGYAWPGVIEQHISHWRYDENARTYAADDIVLLRKFYNHFGRPEANDKDSILAAMVGAVRWRGYAIDVEGLQKLRTKYVIIGQSAPRAPSRTLLFLKPYLGELELSKLRDEKTGRISTKKVLLEAMAKWKKPCPHCLGQFSVMDLIRGEDNPTQCDYCNGTKETSEDHPAAPYAQMCLDARLAVKKVEVIDKLLQAGRFHASFKVIGAFSARMSGTDGLNAQGIDHTKEMRKLFPLAFGDLIPNGGDFSSFEVSIADAVCDDPKLRDALRTCEKCKGLWPLDVFAYQNECPHCGATDNEGKPCRQKFHGIFGQALSPGKTYDEILATKGQKIDLYDQGKRGGFSQFYGGNYSTLMRRLGVSEEIARTAETHFNDTYAGVAKFREGIKELFCSMRQDGPLGSKVEWHDPQTYVESLTGHKRHFDLETYITKKLFDLSTKLPEAWKQVNVLVVRNRDRGPQKAHGALMSALIATAFGIQGSIMRAAANHVIQSTGAELTKMLQVRLWTLQPAGAHPWRIQPMNVHDEIMAPMLKELIPQVKEIINIFIKEYNKMVPLLAIDWSYDMQTWADK